MATNFQEDLEEMNFRVILNIAELGFLRAFLFHHELGCACGCELDDTDKGMLESIRKSVEEAVIERLLVEQE